MLTSRSSVCAILVVCCPAWGYSQQSNNAQPPAQAPGIQQHTIQNPTPNPSAERDQPPNASPIQSIAAQAIPKVTGIAQFNPASSNGSTTTQSFMLQISGQDLPSTTPQVILFPAVNPAPTILSQTATEVMVSFTAPSTFAVQQAVLSYPNIAPVFSQTLAPVTCDTNKDISATFQLIDDNHAKTTFGVGVSKHFLVIQISMVNHCALPITIPLASITILNRSQPDSVCSTPPSGAARSEKTTPPSNESGSTTESQNSFHVSIGAGQNLNLGLILTPLNPYITPSSLGFVTSFYTSDKQVTGRRAIFFNSVSAAAALGSAIQPFFGHGFAEGVAILGGGFTTAAQAIYKDQSAQQLQALTSESFGNAEQLAAHNGSLQKYLYVPSDPSLKCALNHNFVRINYLAIPTLSGGTGTATPGS